MRTPLRAPLWILVLVVLIALAVTMALEARPQTTSALTPPPAPTGTAALFVPATPAADGTRTPHKLLAASTIAQFTVTNEQGMLLGQVENLVVDLHSGTVPYAFLMFGRDPATSDLFFPVPFAAMELNRQGQGFILHGELKDYQAGPPYNRQTLANGPVLAADFRPGFGSGNTTAGGISTPVAAGTPAPPPGVTPIPTVGPLQGPLVLLPQLVGWEVWDTHGQRLGVIQDFPVDAARRSVTWAIMSLGDPLTSAKKLVPVPMQALKLDQRNNHFTLSGEAAAVQGAPSFGQDQWPDTAQPGWDAAFAAFWQKQGARP